ncbi:hypothetical protein SapgrDRAFT_3050 [Saprospira grandis DSM 2844]|uniref:Segregation and condensation protein A n=1 Tax=Saprospira grandis DSM 2844 TaxID=694433 RepID=J0P4C3_9BACT|nr:hypothetical protein SapgrDRAFT_3050 [Saprospira grandis DSM 2844]
MLLLPLANIACAKIGKTFFFYVTYTIKLPQFEGPFDLLLFFIERDELDIYDIPISSITKDFLAYTQELERMNIDLASEFILLAASLMRIKAKMLLPRKELNEEGEEIDPRQELVERLLAYKSYKEVFALLRAQELKRQEQQARGNLLLELQTVAQQALADAELEHLNLFRLLKTYKQLLEKLEERENRPVHKIVHYPYSIEGQRHYLKRQLQKLERARFEDLFLPLDGQMQAIFTFLALLELLQQEKIKILSLSEQYNDFCMLWAEED